MYGTNPENFAQELAIKLVGTTDDLEDARNRAEEYRKIILANFPRQNWIELTRQRLRRKDLDTPYKLAKFVRDQAGWMHRAANRAEYADAYAVYREAMEILLLALKPEGVE